MNITSVSNAVYSRHDNSQINCIITCELGVLPFTARGDDVMPYGVKLFNDLTAGKYGAIAAYVVP